MAAREINLVIDMVNRGAAAVEKDTNILWSLDDLLQAEFDRKFQNDDMVTEPTGNPAITSIYPGCTNMMGSVPDRGNERPFAETRHFVLFGLLHEPRTVAS